MGDGDCCNAPELTMISTHQFLGKVGKFTLLNRQGARDALPVFQFNTEWITRRFNFKKATGAVFINFETAFPIST
jgi:hypothetical protein